MSSFSGFPAGTAAFLRGIAENNDKAWFDAHREAYEAGYVAPAKAFVAAIGPRLREISHDVTFAPKVNGSIFRINRDVRFSRDKRPYRNHLDLWFWHGANRGSASPGFFFRMYSDRLILGAGMHQLEKPQLDPYRRVVVEERSGLRLVETLETVRNAGPYEVGGATRKTVPRGFDPQHERSALLLHEGLWAHLETDAWPVAGTPAFVDFCTKHFHAMWPISRWLLDEVAKA